MKLYAPADRSKLIEGCLGAAKEKNGTIISSIDSMPLSILVFSKAQVLFRSCRHDAAVCLRFQKIAPPRKPCQSQKSLLSMARFPVF